MNITNQSKEKTIAEIVGEIPVAIEPIYLTRHPNDPITLYEGVLELKQGEGVAKAEGKIELSLVADVEVNFSIENAIMKSLNGLGCVDLDETYLSWPTNRYTNTVDVTNVNYKNEQGDEHCVCTGHARNGLIVKNGSDLSYVVFHLLNFSNYHGFNIRSDGSKGQIWNGRVLLEEDGWRIAIDKVQDCSELYKDLKISRGYAVTHVCKLEKADGSTFTAEQTQDVLSSLHWFLSFVRGAWSPPCLPVGFDLSGSRVWESWQNVRATRWKSVPSWFSEVQPAEALNSIFTGFRACWRNPLWHDELKHIVHWYVTSNTNVAALEGSIVLAQTGLELLTWILLVEDQKKFSANNFNSKKNAAERLKELLKHIGVNDAIPPTLINLSVIAPTQGWTNGPGALTGLRNAIEHPNRRSGSSSVSWEARCDLLSLSLWYLELGLLHLFSHQGRYANRTSAARFVGQDVEIVPWEPSQSPQSVQSSI